MEKIGFIGMGTMGLPMALNLLKKNEYKVMGFDVSKKQVDKFKTEQGEAAESIETVAKSCEIIFLCLPTNTLVSKTLMELIELGRTGLILIDLSSTAPDIIQNMFLLAKEKGISLLDAPVSGGEGAAIDGTLAVLCGGDEAVFERVQPLLNCLGRTVTYMGKSGTGSVTKLANNMIVGCNIAAISEAFVFAKKAGIPADRFYKAISKGGAASMILDTKGPKFIARDYRPSARLAVHKKDLENAWQWAEKMGVNIPMADCVLQLMQEAAEDGRLNEDHCCIVKCYEKSMGVEL